METLRDKIKKAIMANKSADAAADAVVLIIHNASPQELSDLIDSVR